MQLLTEEQVVCLHEEVIEPEELQGLAPDKSLHGALHRVENQIYYLGIDDPVRIAALYAEAIACGHCFNDANKRTAFFAMDVFLALNGLPARYDDVEAAEQIRLLAAGKTDVVHLSEWLARHIG